MKLAKSAALSYLFRMLDRADSQAIPAVAPTGAPLPAWARPKNPPESEAEAAFLAGAALARLDALVRDNPPWFGVWRLRLALRAAAASVSRAGRGEDEAALRDAFHLTRPDGRQSLALRRDPGPAGRRLLAWRALTSASPTQWRSQIERAAEVLHVPRDKTLHAAIEAAAACAAGNRLPPFAAAHAYQLARRALAPAGRAGEGELLAAWLADTVLALKLKWPFALPLLGAGQRDAGQRSAEEGGASRRGACQRDAGEGEAVQTLLFGCARRGAGCRSRRGVRAAGGQTRRGRAKTARQGRRGRAAGPARRRLPVGVDPHSRTVRARRAQAVRAAGLAGGVARTDRARDVPALRALSMARTRKPEAAGPVDLELEDLPAPARWREWLLRVEAVNFACSQPVSREQLARVVGTACQLELIIDDIRDELRGRSYEIVSVAGGWSFRTKLGFGEAIRAALGDARTSELSKANAIVLMAVPYFQPITRGELSRLLGREISRDVIAALRPEGLIAAGPRSPTPGVPYAYVTTAGFLSRFAFESLRDLPDIEKLEDAGLIGRSGKGALGGDALAVELSGVLGLPNDAGEPKEDAA